MYNLQLQWCHCFSVLSGVLVLWCQRIEKLTSITISLDPLHSLPVLKTYTSDWSYQRRVSYFTSIIM